MRDHYLIHLVVAGKGVYQSTGPRTRCRRAICSWPSRTSSSPTPADETDPWEYYWVGFNGACANKLVQQTPFSDAHPVHHCKDPQTVREALYNIYLSRGRSRSVRP